MRIISFWGLMLLTFNGQAVFYDTHEIRSETQTFELNNLSQNYIHNYFTAAQPALVIKQLLEANLTPLQREYILNQLLTEISQQPPQDFHQPFVDMMKTYPTQATKMADEGPFPDAIFNLNGKANGIENIWLAYRTEQAFNQKFKHDLPLAVASIADIIAAPTALRRPQWLGVKNSITAMSAEQFIELNGYLKNHVKSNTGLDQLISHVGLVAADTTLIDKALRSNQQAVRELTLRQLNQHLTPASVKSILMAQAKSSDDARFSTALLVQYANDKDVQNYLLGELKNQTTANQAAFALSQSTDLALPEKLKLHYFKAQDLTEKNHILLALKLNKTDVAQHALADLQRQLSDESAASQWLKSFSGGLQ